MTDNLPTRKKTAPLKIERQDRYLPRRRRGKIQSCLEDFLEMFAAHGNLSRAAREANIGVSTVYRYAKYDPEFRTRFHEADEIAGFALRDEVLRRTMDGVTKPVFYKGKQCGEIREYSNKLLLTLLAARYPEFRNKLEPNASPDSDAPLPRLTIKVIDSLEDITDE